MISMLVRRDGCRLPIVKVNLEVQLKRHRKAPVPRSGNISKPGVAVSATPGRSTEFNRQPQRGCALGRNPFQVDNLETHATQG